MRSFATRPRWMVLHVLVALAVPAFAVAGFWQLDRLSERRDDNALVEGRRNMPPAPVEELLADAAPIEHRRVSATGQFDPDNEVTLIGRSLDHRPGDHLLTPLLLEEGAIMVDRGWVPTGGGTETAPPEGPVAVTGILLPSEGGGILGAPDGPAGDSVSRIDVARMRAGLPYDLVTSDVYLLLETQDPHQAGLPEPARTAELGEGSHLIYAVQWFLFIPTLLVVYGALLRSQAKRRAG